MIKSLILSILLISVSTAQPTIVQFGDSHTVLEAGATKAFEEQLGYPVTFQNIGIVGARAEALLKSLKSSGPYTNRLRQIDPKVILVAFGTNEYRMDANTYRELVLKLQKRYPSAKIILLGPPSGKLKRINSVVEIEQMVAKELHVGFVDRRGDFGPLPDGVHLTTKGYGMMAKYTAKKVVEILKK